MSALYRLRDVPAAARVRSADTWTAHVRGQSGDDGRVPFDYDPAVHDEFPGAIAWTMRVLGAFTIALFAALVVVNVFVHPAFTSP